MGVRIVQINGMAIIYTPAVVFDADDSLQCKTEVLTAIKSAATYIATARTTPLESMWWWRRKSLNISIFAAPFALTFSCLQETIN